MSGTPMNRRGFVRALGAFGGGLALGLDQLAAEATVSPGGAALAVPDEGWRLWPDTAAKWEGDRIHLPDDVRLGQLPVNAPTGGWATLRGSRGIPVTLPATVEQFYWGLTGFRPYRDEYKFETSDDEVKNGAYAGVSWWWRPLEIPERFVGRRILLHVRAARLRAEVYLNERLVGYSIMEELPFECDLTAVAQAGANRLAIRITNPGGRLDWVDGSRIEWGGLTMQKSHGFGGIDRGMTLTAHGPVRIADAWALNTPQARTVAAYATLENRHDAERKGTLVLTVMDPDGSAELARAELPVTLAAGATAELRAELSAPQAELWDLDHPKLHRLRADWRPAEGAAGGEQFERSFGFRWFAVDGLGRSALFRLNGRRVRLYTSISWGFWALNGLFPTPELAEKEVRAAKRFGLNTLNFHRNLAKEEVLAIQDRAGLLRCLEPGGGSQAVGSRGRYGAAGDGSLQRYMEAKILGMIRAFRGHPSVVHYIIQNEARLDPSSPAVARLFERMHREDPSRSIVGNDGFVLRSPQVWMEAYGGQLHRSGPHATPEGGAAGWWVDHTGHFSDVWQDAYYVSPKDYYYRSANQGEIVEWGEMKGAASSDDHEAVLKQIDRHGGKSYDRIDHEQILAAYDRFLDTWGFRGAFPTASRLFRSIATRAYDSWGQFLENVRLCDENDMAAVSGWESTAMENHSGLVDNFRDFKADPTPIAESLAPVRAIAKQRQLVLAPGERAVFDVYFCNDTGKPVGGTIVHRLIGPSGAVRLEKSFQIPELGADVFSTLVEEAVTSGPLDEVGGWRSRVELTGFERAVALGAADAIAERLGPSAAGVGSAGRVVFEREILVVAPAPAEMPRLRVGLSGVPEAVVGMLRAAPGVTCEAFTAREAVDVIVAASGVGVKDVAVDAEGAYKPGIGRPAVAGGFSGAVLEAMQHGVPVLGLADGVGQGAGMAKQLETLGALKFLGLVGPSRASWMGSWYFVRKHALYDGLPVDQAMGLHYQVKGGGSDGWRVESTGRVQVVAGYGRDHDRHVGAGTLVARVGGTRVVLHSILGMQPVLLQRFLANALKFLHAGEVEDVAGTAPPAKLRK